MPKLPLDSIAKAAKKLGITLVDADEFATEPRFQFPNGKQMEIGAYVDYMRRFADEGIKPNKPAEQLFFDNRQLLEDFVDSQRGLTKASGVENSPVEDFLFGLKKNAWVEQDGYNAYLRKSKRMLPGAEKREALDTLDIANVEYQGVPGSNRSLPSMLKSVEDSARRGGMKALYAENILNEKLPNILPRLGFKEDKAASFVSGVPSYYKKLALLLAALAAAQTAKEGMNDA